jgi:hypothetical protein
MKTFFSLISVLITMLAKLEGTVLVRLTMRRRTLLW